MKTIKELREIAKTLGIHGRGDMTKTQLETAIANKQEKVMENNIQQNIIENEVTNVEDCIINTPVEIDQEEMTTILENIVEEEKAEKILAQVEEDAEEQLPAQVEEDVEEQLPAKRTPFRKRYYYLNETYLNDGEGNWERFNKQPKQVRDMYHAMVSMRLVNKEKSTLGKDICAQAIDRGFVTSKIAPAVLFAYYRGNLETLGLKVDTSKK